MAVREGSCRFGLWHVQVWWSGDLVHQVRFSRSPIAGPVPGAIRRYLAGKETDLSTLRSIATEPGAPFSAIYRITRDIPYGETMTYGAIAALAGTAPRVVGMAMSRNPTPLVIPCHRVVAASGLGGFSPDIAIKEALLALERKNRGNIIT